MAFNRIGKIMAGGIGFDIRILGDKKLGEKLKKLPLKMQKQVLRKSLRNGAKILRAAARARAPVSALRTRPAGKHLKDTIKTFTGKVAKKAKQKKGEVRAGIKTGTREELGILPHEKYYYPAAVELGFFNKRANKKIRPRPFMKDALKANRKNILNNIARDIRRGINTI